MPWSSPCPPQTVVAPTQTVYDPVFHPQPVQVVHPIEIIRQHYCVPMPYHVPVVCVKDEVCTVSSVKRRKKRK